MAAPLLAMKALQNRPRISVGQKTTRVLLATGLGVGIFLIGRSLYKKHKRDIMERRALNPNSAASFATRLKLAFENDSQFGWGTDEEAVFRAIEQLPDFRTFLKTQKAYKDLYGNNLMADLKSELTTEEYNIVLDLLTSKT